MIRSRGFPLSSTGSAFQPPSTCDDPLTILVFRLASDRYGIPVEHARQILLAVRVTPLPGSPPVVEGVVDVRGALVPVFDMSRRFGLVERELGIDDHFILATAGEREALLHVERVEGVEEVEDTEDPRALVSGVERLTGVGRLKDGLVLIHDLRTFLTEAEADALDAALTLAETGGGETGGGASGGGES